MSWSHEDRDDIYFLSHESGIHAWLCMQQVLSKTMDAGEAGY
jgi:hypothetical protein